LQFDIFTAIMHTLEAE